MDTIFYNGIIHTLDKAYPEVSALAIKDGVILCIIRSFSNGRGTDSLNSIIIRSCGRNGSIGCCSGSIWSCYGRRRSWHPCNGGSIKVC